MNINQSNKLLEMIIEEIQLPDNVYKQAETRYEDIGLWLENDSVIQQYKPTVFPQGSFRSGTAVKPVGREEFDLDLVCKIQIGISKRENTQKQLKDMVGNALSRYRAERGIKEDLTEKRRCLRLIYADNMKFHMDILPCIPNNTSIISGLNFKEHLVSITDNQSTFYSEITDDWMDSNPEGFAQWFESRMNMEEFLLIEHAKKLGMDFSQFANLPKYQWKTPLQKSVQLLKRHRDVMFLNNQDLKPISIIITTLAASAYQGESDVTTAITNILASMVNFVRILKPYVPNPVNPEENFADKWSSNPKLRDNFERWVIQARADIHAICSQSNRQIILDSINNGFKCQTSKSTIDSALGLAAISIPATNVIADSPKPWRIKID